MARARLAWLPDIHPAKRVAQATQRAGIPDTSLHHSASVLRHFQIGWDLWDSTFSIPSEVCVSVKARRNVLWQYAKHVQPFLLSSDYEWFKDALAALNSEELIPLTSSHCTNHGPLKNNGKPGQYHFGRIWSVARIIGGAPHPLWGFRRFYHNIFTLSLLPSPHHWFTTHGDHLSWNNWS